MTAPSSFDIFRMLYLAWLDCDEARYNELYQEFRDAVAKEGMD